MNPTFTWSIPDKWIFLVVQDLSSEPPLIRTEHRRLREFFQHFYPKCNINWGFQLFWSAYKPKTKNNFFGPKSAVQSQFLGKCLGLEKNFISQILFKI